MNILLPSVGRKYLLAKMLGEALTKRGGKLIAADASPLASGLYAAPDTALLPGFDAPGFRGAVDDLIAERAIDAVIPVRDAELASWARWAEEGTLKARVFGSPSTTLDACYDKWELFRAAGEAGVRCPPTELVTRGKLPTGSIPCPVVVKPRRGAGSNGVRMASGPVMLAALLMEASGDALIQSLVEGTEFTVDCYAGADTTLKAAVVRKRLSIVGGQSDIGETVYDEELTSLCRKLAARLKFRGAVNMQFIRGERGPMLIDVNPRFSGGVAISRAAGADLAEWTVADLHSEATAFPASYRLLTWLGHADGRVMDGSPPQSP